MKGKGKGKKSNEGSNSQPSSFAQTSTIPPWPTPETALTQPQAPIPPGQAATATMGTELLSAVRKTYPDISQAPEDIKKAVEEGRQSGIQSAVKRSQQGLLPSGQGSKTAIVHQRGEIIPPAELFEAPSRFSDELANTTAALQGPAKAIWGTTCYSLCFERSCVTASPVCCTKGVRRSLVEAANGIAMSIGGICPWHDFLPHSPLIASNPHATPSSPQ